MVPRFRRLSVWRDYLLQPDAAPARQTTRPGVGANRGFSAADVRPCVGTNRIENRTPDAFKQEGTIRERNLGRASGGGSETQGKPRRENNQAPRKGWGPQNLTVTPEAGRVHSYPPHSMP